MGQGRGREAQNEALAPGTRPPASPSAAPPTTARPPPPPLTPLRSAAGIVRDAHRLHPARAAARRGGDGGAWRVCVPGGEGGTRPRRRRLRRQDALGVVLRDGDLGARDLDNSIAPPLPLGAQGVREGGAGEARDADRRRQREVQGARLRDQDHGPPPHRHAPRGARHAPRLGRRHPRGEGRERRRVRRRRLRGAISRQPEGLRRRQA